MRVADYIFRTLADRGAKHVFLVTGGGAMHLNDALRREKRLRYICCLHEQACAMAAEGYARIAGSPGIVSVTTGPGGTNALTGVLGAWVDSIPMLVISGQVKRATTIEAAPGIHLRQLGDQEINIIDIVRPITKYAVMVRRPEEIVPVLDRAWEECRSGRPGPVWIDVPLDIQAAELPDTLRPGAEPVPARQAPDHALLREAVERLRTARRPVIVAGNGVTLAGAREKFRKLMAQLHVPVLTTLSGIDLLPSDSPVFFGRPGILEELMPEVSTGRTALRFILFCAAVALVILAAARPQFGSKLREEKAQGIEMMLTVDVSNSMLAEDFEPNRLERTKYAIGKLFEGLQQDRVGLVVFAGEPKVQLPIT